MVPISLTNDLKKKKSKKSVREWNFTKGQNSFRTFDIEFKMNSTPTLLSHKKKKTKNSQTNILFISNLHRNSQSQKSNNFEKDAS